MTKTTKKPETKKTEAPTLGTPDHWVYLESVLTPLGANPETLSVLQAVFLDTKTGSLVQRTTTMYRPYNADGTIAPGMQKAIDAFAVSRDREAKKVAEDAANSSVELVGEPEDVPTRSSVQS